MKRGLSLPEVILALAVLAVALVSLVLVFGRGLTLQRKSAQLVQATQAAQRELEAIRDLPFADLPTTATDFDGRVPQPAVGGFPPAPYPGDESRLRVHIEPRHATLRWVRVEAFYSGGSLLLETFLAP